MGQQDKGKISRQRNFVIGDSFEDGVLCVAQGGFLRLSGNAMQTFIKPKMNVVIKIPEDMPALSVYVAPVQMDDEKVEQLTSLQCMELEQLGCSMYLLLHEPEAAEEILGCKLNKGTRYDLPFFSVEGEPMKISLIFRTGKYRNEWWAHVFPKGGKVRPGTITLYFKQKQQAA